MKMINVAVIGSGLIGRAWAVVFAKAGHQVMMYDTDPACREGVAASVKAECEILHRHGLLSDISAVLNRINVSSDLSQAVQAADFIQENGPERVEVKQALFAELDSLAPADTPIASSTSAIPASQFTQTLTVGTDVLSVIRLTRLIWFLWLRYAGRPGHLLRCWTGLMKFTTQAAWFLFGSRQKNRALC